MKRFLITVSTAVILCGCQKDFRYDNMVDNSAHFSSSGLQTVDVININDADFKYDIWVYKAGWFGEKKLLAGIELDYSYLMEYNSSYGTEYEMLDSKYYSVPDEITVGEGKEDNSGVFTFHTDKVVADLGYGEYYIPMTVRSKSPDTDVTASTGGLLLKFNITRPVIIIDSDWGGVSSYSFGSNPPQTYEFDITTVLNTKADQNYTVYYDWNPMIAFQGNVMNPSLCEFSATATMKKGTDYAENYLTLDVAGMPKGSYVIPISISVDNPRFTCDPDAGYVLLTVIKR